jgi:hypothetical protein
MCLPMNKSLGKSLTLSQNKQGLLLHGLVTQKHLKQLGSLQGSEEKRRDQLQMCFGLRKILEQFNWQARVSLHRIRQR